MQPPKVHCGRGITAHVAVMWHSYLHPSRGRRVPLLTICFLQSFSPRATGRWTCFGACSSSSSTKPVSTSHSLSLGGTMAGGLGVGLGTPGRGRGVDRGQGWGVQDRRDLVQLPRDGVCPMDVGQTGAEDAQHDPVLVSRSPMDPLCSLMRDVPWAPSLPFCPTFKVCSPGGVLEVLVLPCAPRGVFRALGTE